MKSRKQLIKLKSDNSRQKSMLIIMGLSGILILSLYCIQIIFGNRDSAQIDQMPWNRDDIFIEDHREMSPDHIYKHFTFNPKNGFITANPSINQTTTLSSFREPLPCFERSKSTDDDEIKLLKEIEDELLEDYQEYKGKLYDGNIIKRHLCSELNYLDYVIRHSRDTHQYWDYYDRAYTDYSLDIKTTKDAPNSKEIHEKVTAWVNQDPNTYGDDEEENRQTFLKMIESSLPVRTDLYDIKQATSDMSNGIDDLLDFLHENFDTHKSDLKNYKIWTLDGFFRFFNDIDVKNKLNLKTKLKSILKRNVYHHMQKTILPNIICRRDQLIEWIANYQTKYFRLYGIRRSRNPRIWKLLYYQLEILIPEELFEEFAPQYSKTDLGRPSPKIKHFYGGVFIKIFSSLVTEASDQFKERRRKQEEELTTNLFENLCKGFEPDVEGVIESQI